MSFDSELQHLGYQPHEVEFFNRFAKGISNESFYKDTPDAFSPDSRVVVLRDTRFFVELFEGKKRTDCRIGGTWKEVCIQIARLAFQNKKDWWEKGKSIDQIDCNLDKRCVTVIKKDGQQISLPVEGMENAFRSLRSSISGSPLVRPLSEKQSSRPDANLQSLAERRLGDSSHDLGMVLMNRGSLNLYRGAETNVQKELTESEQAKLDALKRSVLEMQNIPCDDFSWEEELLYDGVVLKTYCGSLFGKQQNLTQIEIDQRANRNPFISPLISKVSEAMYPREPANHIGDGATIKEIFEVQKYALVAVNLIFQHYLEDYYRWDGDAYHLGDPVGWNKIRNNCFGNPDEIDQKKDWGYLCQKAVSEPFEILPPSAKDQFLKYHYAVGCVPLICRNHQITPLEEIDASPLAEGQICPPGNLGHLYSREPRTIVGINDDGALVFLTVDGRQPEAIGMNYPEMASLIAKLGWKDALNLDGGGSTAIYDRTRGYLNHPKDKDKDRKLCTLFLLNDSKNFPKYHSRKSELNHRSKRGIF